MACFSSTLLYVKFLALWLLVILADFILEFRFEFLWPFWLLLRSVYDSFKYQGLVSALSPHETKSSPLTRTPLFITGLLCFLHLHCSHLRHDLFLFHPSPLAFLRSEHICLGAVRLAYRFVFVFHGARKGSIIGIKYSIAESCQ